MSERLISSLRFKRKRAEPVRGFTLVEVLLAVMILGIGMIMIAGIFPVGANWTRQTAEESVAGLIAKNAVNIIQTKYTSSNLTSVGTSFIPLPGIGGTGSQLPPIERAYGFGMEPPYPIDVSVNPTRWQQATYFWTALIRAQPTGHSYDLYILVVKKGSAEQTYTNSAGLELMGTRDPANDVPILPYVATLAVTPVPSPTNPNLYPQFNVSSPPQAIRQSLIGSQVIDAISGTVLRVTAGTNNSTLFNVNGSLNNSSTQLYFVPPADGTAESPLVYVYQTTVSF